MRIVHRIVEMRAARADGGEVVGLVPTMGGLHGGHEALFHAARPDCDLLVASLFVNAPQFSQPADL
ncbi:MAG TPA: pantoate--beta-alanine ligase, partial [Gaiellaceae bacterium]